MRIAPDQLPPEIVDYYENEAIHKATKQGTSTIVIQVRPKRDRNDVWKKKGAAGWVLQSLRKGGKTRPKLGKPPNFYFHKHLFGTVLPEGVVKDD